MVFEAAVQGLGRAVAGAGPVEVDKGLLHGRVTGAVGPAWVAVGVMIASYLTGGESAERGLAPFPSAGR